MNNDKADIEIKGKIDISSLDTQINGTTIGEGVGQMQMILRVDGILMKVKINKITFEGTKSISDPNRYPASNER